MNLESHIQYHIRYFLTNIRPAHIKHRYIVPPVFPSLTEMLSGYHSITCCACPDTDTVELLARLLEGRLSMDRARVVLRLPLQMATLS